MKSDTALFVRGGRVGEAAVIVIGERSGTGQRAGHSCNAGGEVDAICAGRVIADDIDSHGRIFSRLRTAVVPRGWRIIDNRDCERFAVTVAVSVGHRYRQHLRRTIAAGIVRQRECVIQRS